MNPKLFPVYLLFVCQLQLFAELQEEMRKKEEAKERAFRAEVRKWNLRKMMRDYIVERERALEGNSVDPVDKGNAREWIAWAKRYVERIDPLNKGFGMTETTECLPGAIDEDSDETS